MKKSNERGYVYLVGAGPGDEELITVKGLECIKKAEVLVYDRLASEKFLDYADKEAELIFVGKMPDRHVYTQEEINELIVSKAKEGKTVTRLKGGDPFVFGRGGEEALLLAEENITFEVVPGITSAVAAPAYAGIPVTHRGLSSSLSVVTGHEDPTKETSQLNWKELSTATDTLCILMGVSNLESIVDNLIKYGRSPKTPAALVRWGTRPLQKTLVGTLEDITRKAREHGFSAPSVIIVGDVVNLKDKLSWFENKPLFNRRIIVTRARQQASDLSRRIKELGGEPLEYPAIKIVSPDSYEKIDAAINDLRSYQWLIFTSINGVELFFQRLFSHGKDIRELKDIGLCAIGPKTREGLMAKGLKVDVVPEEYRAEAVVNELKARTGKGDNVLIPRAQVAREILPESLREMGLKVDVAPVYKTVKEENKISGLKEILENKEVDAITFTSSSTVKNFAMLLGNGDHERLLNDVFVACIGPITTETCESMNIKVDVVAKEYTIPGLVDALLEGLA